MKALKYRGPWDVAIEDVPDLHATGPDDVVVDIAYTGICGTDLGVVAGYYPVAVPGTTLGHESTGVVAEVGPEVAGVAVGDRVVINPTPYCGVCRMCRTQRINHCVNKDGTESGISYDGTYAHRYRTTSRFVHRVPEHITLQGAALTEPLSCVVSGVRKIRPTSLTAFTYVFGAGPLGLLYAWALSWQGLSPVVVETAPARLAFANKVLPQGIRAYGSLAEARREHFGDVNAPIDVVVDTTSGLLEELYEELAPGGIFMSIGLKRKKVTVDAMHLADRSLSVIGSIDSLHGSFDEAFHMITSGRLPAERLVSHVVPLEEYRTGFAALGCDIDRRVLAGADTESCKVLIASAPEAGR
ncbi:zinc-dependent alcohol dehydrogenase [Streptomyces litchfieldiae]|uniref:Alcohol dehydrogenase catalytic domain-containing protein n=1 Tax=Streptomyces litchfieldiae TaxID=3075543 RepID=A0ABU2MU78_9ACTN|nr:alcohol dehydrogenase catalytic domain-containing protein [Streptomyces sp. DSM 44938]MDT0345105.1 alcohol dehydrogenase catalytic domain-containing protein [Streptomyces sp. DSM 44938]